MHVLQTSSGAAATRASAGLPPRVLVVDDDKAIRTLVRTILTRNAYLVQTARNGEEAIDAMAGSKFDVIILDPMMPKVDGFEVIEQMARTAPEQLRRRVIVLTAVASKDLGKMDGIRVFRVIRKPFDLNDLVSAVAECADGDGG